MPNFAGATGTSTSLKHRSNGGMVDTKDLKSFGYCSCAGSSPASSTNYEMSVLYTRHMFKVDLV